MMRWLRGFSGEVLDRFAGWRWRLGVFVFARCIGIVVFAKLLLMVLVCIYMVVFIWWAGRLEIFYT